MHYQSVIGLLTAVLLAAAGPMAGAFNLEVQQFQLDNGLTILTFENHDAPVISFYTFYKVGGRNERPGITGISHFFEHMMFNGAAKYGPKMFDLVLESNGGYSNAYTSKDMTVYYEDFASENLELILDLESDRMASLALAPEMLESEIGVVKEERRVSIDNNNGGLVYNGLFAAAYQVHPYGWPVLGYMADLSSISRENCLEYFETYYAPNNAIVVIAGDFETERAVDLMKKYFNDIPSGPPPPRVVPDEPEQLGPRRSYIERPSQYAHFMRGYHVGNMDSPDLFALEIIQYVLTTGESCRLQQALVNELELSLGIYGGFSWGFDPTLFYFYAGAVPGKDYGEIEKAFDSLLTDFTVNGPTDNELIRAQNGLTADFYKRFKTNNGTADRIGQYQILYGDWRKMYSFVDNIKKVTADDVKAAAARYFRPNNSTTIVLIPEGGAR